MSTHLADPTYAEDLGHGLIRRWSTPADQEKIAHCLGTVFRNSAEAPLNVRAMDETRVMMSPGFPFMGPGDVAIVEDTSLPERPVVACTFCWSHRWSYGGIPFGVGQPEMVGTLPDYRNRGLVRAVFEMFHARSAAKGELVQAITGIPYFYRQFGYEFVLDLEGRRLIHVAGIPELDGDKPEPYSLRLATFDDAPHLLALYNLGRSASLVWHETTESDWRFHIACWEEPAVRRQGPHPGGAGGAHAHDRGRRWSGLRLRVAGIQATEQRAGGLCAPTLSPRQLASGHALIVARLSCARPTGANHNARGKAIQRNQLRPGPRASGVCSAERDPGAPCRAALCLVSAGRGYARLHPPHCAGSGAAVGRLDSDGPQRRPGDRFLPRRPAPGLRAGQTRHGRTLARPGLWRSTRRPAAHRSFSCNCSLAIGAWRSCALPSPMSMPSRRQPCSWTSCCQSSHPPWAR